MIRTAMAAAALLGAAACAETPSQTRDAAPSGAPADTSAQSPLTVNPAPEGALPATPPTLPPEDPARIPEDDAMPPGPVNPKG